MKLALLVVLYCWLFYVLYLAYTAIHAAKLNGKYAAAALPAKVVMGSVFLVGALFDVVFNMTLGSLLFVEPPKQMMFTKRLDSWMGTPTWRGRLADWFCNGWLNPLEAHCKK